MSGATMSPEELRALDVRVAEARGELIGFVEWAETTAVFRNWRDRSGKKYSMWRYSSDPVASRVLLDEMCHAEGCGHVYIQWFAPDGCWIIQTDQEPFVSVYEHDYDAAIALAWLAWHEGQG